MIKYLSRNNRVGKDMVKKILLFGSNDRACLTLTRSLGHAGHHVAILRLSAHRSAADFSRFCAYSFHLGSPDSGVREYVAKLAELLFSHRFDYLVPIDNLTCDLTYFDYATISSLTCVIGPSPAFYRKIHNRFEALALAESAGIALPPTVLMKQDEVRLPAIPAYPCFVKPVSASAIVEDELQRFSVRTVNCIDELDAKLRDDLPRTDVMLQTVVLGARIELNFCAIDGDVLAASVTMPLHEFRRKGGSSYKKSGEVTPEILAAIQHIAGQICLTGFMTIECKRENGCLVFIDMKCWPADSISLSIFAGVDFPKLLIEGLERRCGMGNVQLANREVCIRHLYKDIDWLFAELAKGGGLKAIVSWIGSWGGLLSGRERLEVEHMGDFWPAVGQFNSLMKSVGAKMTMRLFTVLMRAAVLQPEAVILKKTSSLLIVCKGNINRSLVAEHLFKARGFTRVQSAGLLGMPGRRPSKHAEDFLYDRVGIAGAGLRSRSVVQALRDTADIDIVLCFERRQVVEMAQRFPKLRGKVFLLAVLARDYQRGMDIPDPHGASAEAYRACFRRIEKLVDEIVSIMN